MNLHLLLRRTLKAALLPFGLTLLLLLTGCGGSNNSNAQHTSEDIALPGCADTSSCVSNPELQIGESRPAQVQIPSDYTPTTRYPLIIILHGYGANGALQAGYLGLTERVDSKQYVLVVPDGTESLNGTRFWNATPACCARVAAAENQLDEQQYTEIDDVAYIRELVKEAAATYSIDTQRIGLVGHSNGGFMALRMVCEASELITSVVSLAGSTFEADSSCTPAADPVSVLIMHGDDDGTISYDGSEILSASYPGAIETTERFAAHAGCNSSEAAMAANIDMVENIEGAETTVVEMPQCERGTEVALWTLVGAPHIPFPWVPSGLDRFVDWVLEHPREQK